MENKTAQFDYTHKVDAEELESFISFCHEYPDFLGHDYIGYWACGIARINGGRIIHTDCEAIEEETDFKAIVDEFKRSGTLPGDFRFINRETGLAVANEHIKRYGTLDYDGATFDVAFQTVVLGEVVYG